VLSLFAKKIDKNYIIANILPSLKYIMENDRIPSISMAVVGCYQAFSDSLGPDYISTAVLPTILPILIDKSLDRKQFETIVDLVKRLLRKLTERRTADFNMDPVHWGEKLNEKEFVDPFAAAKVLLNSTRSMLQHQREAFEQRLADVPPPVPSLPPPPPPSGPPPPPPPLPPSMPPSDSYTGSSLASRSFQYEPQAPAVSSYSAPMSTMPLAPLFSSMGSTSAPLGGFGAPTQLFPTPPAPSSSLFGSPPLPSKVDEPAKAPEPPAPAVAKSSSRSSWFSKSKPAETAPPAADLYQPPVVPLAPSSSSFPTSTELKSESIDLDDFMSSLANKPKPSTSAPASSSGGWNSVNTANQSLSYAPPASQIAPTPNTAQNASNFAFLSSSISSSAAAPTQPTSVSSGTNQLSLEQQLQQTQAEIARLSGSLNTSSNPAPSASGGFPSTVGGGNPPPAGSYGYPAYGQPPAATAASSNNFPSTGPSSSGFPSAANYNQSNASAFPPSSTASKPPSYSNMPAYSTPSSTTATAGYNNPSQQFPSSTPQSYNHQFVTSYLPGTNNPPAATSSYGVNPVAYHNNPPPPAYGTSPMGYGGNNPAAGGMMNMMGNPSGGYANMGQTNYSAASTAAQPVNNYANKPQQQQPPPQQQQLQPQQQQFYSNYSSAGGAMNSGNVGSLPTSYQPPVAYSAPQMAYNNNPPSGNMMNTNNPANNQKKGNNVGNAFDFLS
jgi:hypothetical protein